MIARNIYRQTSVAMLAVGIVALAACSQDYDTTGDTPTDACYNEATLYWNTRTRSTEMQQTMLRNHAIGFSYDAVGGEKCDVNSVRCQVINIDSLDDDMLYFDQTGGSIIKNSKSMSVAEYLHNAYVQTKSSADLVLYNKTNSKTASLIESGHDTTLCITSEMSKYSGTRIIKAAFLQEAIMENPKRYLTPNFIYAIDKIKRSNLDEQVADSFINIFGTHVVTYVRMGARLKVDFVGSRRSMKTFAQEEIVKEKSLDYLLGKISEMESTNDQKLVKTFLDNAKITVSAYGGDLSLISSMIANPKGSTVNSEVVDKWLGSVKMDANTPWNENCELEDMDVTPIWEFIPDEKVAAVVESRIHNSAELMQRIYGDLNFVNVAISIDPYEYSSIREPKGDTSWGEPYVVDLIAANRHVATICMEWVPEIDPDWLVKVVYPIYEGKLQEQSAFCCYNGKAYRLRWDYNRFQVTEEPDTCGGIVYLTNGYIEQHPIKDANYLTPTLVIGYEWPGSIGINGNLTDTHWYETRRFLGNFYLDTDEKFDNLPNWTYTDTQLHNSNYDKWLNERGDRPYFYSGITLSGRHGQENTINRMVRNKDYTYFFNRTELGL